MSILSLILHVGFKKKPVSYQYAPCRMLILRNSHVVMFNYKVGDHCRHFTKIAGHSSLQSIVILYHRQLMQMAFCDLLHAVQKLLINISLQVFVALPWEIKTGIDLDSSFLHLAW